MARPREFDVEEALDRAMEVFWSRGYRATSLQNLLEATGLSSSSFYEAFGSKHALYLRSLERYRDRFTPTGPITRLEQGDSPRAAIRDFFDFVVNTLVSSAGRQGCFFGRSSMEVGADDPEAAARSAEGFRIVENAFRAAVARGQSAGEIDPNRDARALGRALTSTFYGLQVMARSNPDMGLLRDVKEEALRSLD